MIRRIRTAAVFAATSFVAVLCPGVAGAQAPPDPEPRTEPATPPAPPADTPRGEPDRRAQAMERYARGVEAYEAGRYKDAVDLFLAADQLAHSAAFAFNASLAFEKMGDDAGALRWAREYLRRAPAAPDAPLFRERVDRFQAALAAKGLQQLTVRSTPPAATLLVDGRPVGITPWIGEHPPGQHTLELRLPGHLEQHVLVVLPADRALDVDLSLAERPAPTPAPLAPAPPPVVRVAPPAPGPPPLPADDGLSPWSFVLLGAGGAAFVVAGGLEVARAAAEQGARDAVTQLQANHHVEAMRDRQLAARVLAGAGATLAAVGVTVLVVELSAMGEKPATARAGVRAGLHGASLVGALAW